MELLPNGAKLKARAQHWKLGETTTGKEQVAVDLAIVGPDGSTTNRMWFGFFTDAATPMTLKALRAMGWKGTDPLELDTPQADLNANEVEIEIEHEEYNGVWRDRVRWVNAIGGGGVGMITTLAPEKRAAFAQRMKATFLQIEQGQSRPAPKKPATPKPADVTPGADDDIPF